MTDTDKITEERLRDARFLPHGWNRWRRPEWPISWTTQEYAVADVREEPDPVSVLTEEALRIARSERAEADARMLNELAAGLLAGGCDAQYVPITAKTVFFRVHGREPEVMP